MMACNPITPGEILLEEYLKLMYVHTVQDDCVVHEHNLPASYCLKVGP